MATKMRHVTGCEESRPGQPGVGIWKSAGTGLLPVAGDLDSRVCQGDASSHRVPCAARSGEGFGCVPAL
ncbi:hypothetical protein V492_03339 [Pseudogymnoascus sp. VKM F-4246]|nr:hypothetical protein V492_03339 [Pseudogymnoascus sp. VKM F-4246]